MSIQKLLICSVLLIGCSLLPSRSGADDETSRLLKSEVMSFYAQLRSGEFDQAFSRVEAGASGYLPFGVLGEIPSQAARDGIVAKYKEAFAEGHRAKLTPAYLKVADLGDVAITTFLAQGKLEHPVDASSKQVLRRVSLVWRNTDAGWKIVHWHSSCSEVDGSHD